MTLNEVLQVLQVLQMCHQSRDMQSPQNPQHLQNLQNLQNLWLRGSQRVHERTAAFDEMHQISILVQIVTTTSVNTH